MFTTTATAVACGMPAVAVAVRYANWFTMPVATKNSHKRITRRVLNAPM